jgi:DNA invertase Pin-like site-specific DNA recombinase
MTDVGYARVSTADQNPQLQLNALEQAGCDVIFEERVSGVSKKRPVRDQVLDMVKPGDRITVWALDRWGRSTSEVLDILKDLESRDVAFRCLLQPVDTRTSMGKMFIGFLAVMAEFERSLLQERVRAGKQRMMAEGQHPGGRALFGFEDDHMTVIEEQAALLREAVQRLDQGLTLSNVVDDWNARGLRPGNATHWRVTHLRRILLNERVIPIIGQKDYDRLQRLFGNPERRRGGRPAEHILSGILVCGRCGRPMYGTYRTRRDGSREDTYRCEAGKGSGGRHTGCGRVSVARSRADEWAREAFISVIVSPAFATALSQRQAEVLAGDITAAELDEYRAEIIELEQVLGTRFGTDDMRKRHGQLQKLVRDATARLLQRPDLQALIDLPKSEEALRRAWDRWSVAERRQWLKRVLDRIEVKPAVARGPGSSVAERLDPVWKT